MDRPLKIAHLALSSLPATVGGLQVVVDSLIREQRASGHQVHLVTRWRQWQAARQAGETQVLPLPPRLRVEQTPFLSIGPRWPVALAAMLHQLRHRFDVWHAHWVYPTGWMVYDALSRLKVPVVMTAHGADIQVETASGYGFRQFPQHDRHVRELLPRARALTAISDSIAQTYLELGARPEAIHSISNGVDVEHIAAASRHREATRAQYGIAPGTAVLLTVGRNEPRKGVQFIPEMLRRLKDRGRDVVWFVVGKDTGLLAPQLEREGVGDMARLLPPFGQDGTRRFPPDALARLYGAADIYAFPSLNEGFGLVALEAMAAGVPVVANDVPGIRDVVAHERDGLLCPPGDPEAMVGAIGRLLDDAVLCRKLSQAGRMKAQLHDWSVIAEQYCALYRSLIA